MNPIDTMCQLPPEIETELRVENPYLHVEQPDRARLLDALLRRGYLISPTPVGLQFDDLPHPEDFQDLSELLGIQAQLVQAIQTENFILIRDNNSESCIPVPRSPDEIDSACGKLKEDVQRIKLRGHYWHGAPWPGRLLLERRQNWEGFKNLKFGTKVPVAMLDPGVALMVKVFSWYGVGTGMSCHGHGSGRKETPSYGAPYIGFLTEDHGMWAKVIMMSAFPKSCRFLEWRFTGREVEHKPGYVNTRPCGAHQLSEELYLQIHEVLYLMARRLMNPEYAKRFREMKARLEHHDLWHMSHEVEHSHRDPFILRP